MANKHLSTAVINFQLNYHHKHKVSQQQQQTILSQKIMFLTKTNI